MREFIFTFLIVITVSNAFAACDPGYYQVQDDCEQCDEGNYCEGGTNSPKSCSEKTNHLFPNSDEGSDDITDCYTDGYAADGTNPGCEDKDTGINSSCKVHCLAAESDYTSIHSYADAYDYGLSAKCDGDLSWNNYYHIEVDNEQLFCLGETLLCNKFTNTNCTNSGDILTGTANYANNKWELGTCHCEKSFSDTNNRHCNGIERFNASPASTPNFFNQINFSGNSSYYCNKCQDEYYVKQTGGGCSAPPEDATKVVCKCEEKIPKGSYAVSSECTWNASTLSYTPCQPHPCPKPGQTTLNDGAMDAGLCTYAPNTTQFCDAKGCFTLSSTDIDEWDFNY